MIPSEGGTHENYELAICTEGKIASEIMKTVRALGLPLKLDKLTEGQGNCFPIAIIQQLRRPEIYEQLKLKDRTLTRIQDGHKALRLYVVKFIIESENPNVTRFQSKYNELESGLSGETCSQYWTRLSKDKVWVDFWFVQAAAWYLQLDLWIVDCESRDDHPFIQVSGNLDNAEVSCGGPILTLGTKSSCHYQSLLPTEFFHLEFNKILICDIINKSTTKGLSKNSPITEHKDNSCKSEIELNTISCSTYYDKSTKITLENLLSKEILKEEIIGPVTRSIAELNREPAPVVIKTNEYQPFMYEDNGKVVIFKHDYILRWP